ncbi:MAG: sugar phosphate nucleotidyltransferase, partial [bacterium]
IVPIAGVGSRLRPHTYHIPKALLPLAGKPMVSYIVEQLLSWEIEHIVFVIGHLGEMIQEYLRKTYPEVSMEFRVQEKPLGLGHAVLTGLDPEDGEVVILLGDTILDTDLTPYLQKGKTALGVAQVEDPRRFGVVVVENQRVIKLVEKPAEPISQLALVGIYLIRSGKELSRAIKEVMERGITVKGEYQLTDALGLLLEWGEEMVTFPVEGWYDCGKVDTLLATQRFLFNKIDTFTLPEVCEDSLIVQPVHFSSGVRVIRSVVGPYVTLGERCTIENSVLQDAIIGEEVHLGGLVIRNSLIGRRVKLNKSPWELNLGASSEGVVG